MDKPVIGLVFNPPQGGAEPFAASSTDVLTQVAAVEQALVRLGHRAVRIPFDRDLKVFLRQLEASGAHMVFNLCETVDEDARLAGHPAAVLELLGLPFTGSGAVALMLTTDKALTKRLLKTAGILTPNYIVYDPAEPPKAFGLSFPVIIKPLFEDASVGITQASVVENTSDLTQRAAALSKQFGALLVEEYIAGREFNVSVFGFPHARVLPVAEIDFCEYPAGVYPILDYRAKWDKASFEYTHTVRRFPRNLSLAMQRKLEMTAHVCFRTLKLRDYGRVDLRVNSRREIYVLEVNANPCISPDAGFPAAVEQSGRTYSDMVAQFVAFMARRSG